MSPVYSQISSYPTLKISSRSGKIWTVAMQRSLSFSITWPIWKSMKIYFLKIRLSFAFLKKCQHKWNEVVLRWEFQKNLNEFEWIPQDVFQSRRSIKMMNHFESWQIQKELIRKSKNPKEPKNTLKKSRIPPLGNSKSFRILHETHHRFRAA